MILGVSEPHLLRSVEHLIWCEWLSVVAASRGG